MIISLSTKRTGNIAAMNIYKSFTHKMAAKTSWHRCETKLRDCYPMYTPIPYRRRSNGCQTSRETQLTNSLLASAPVQVCLPVVLYTPVDGCSTTTMRSVALSCDDRRLKFITSVFYFPPADPKHVTRVTCHEAGVTWLSWGCSVGRTSPLTTFQHAATTNGTIIRPHQMRNKWEKTISLLLYSLCNVKSNQVK